MRRLTAEMQREWQNWGQLSCHANEGIRANAGASLQEVVARSALLPAEAVGQHLSPDAVAAIFLCKA